METKNLFVKIGVHNTKCKIVGGGGVVSSSIYSELNNIGIQNIKMLAGINRYETNAIVINKFKDNNVKSIYLAKGLTLVDTLTVAPILSSTDSIIITENSLTENQKNSIVVMDINKVVKARGGITTDYVKVVKNILN